MMNKSYEELKQFTLGILRTMDMGLIHTDTLMAEAEKLLLKNSDIWLAAGAYALAAWASDEKDIAERALAISMEQNGAKTSLLFALICFRAGRNKEAQEWMKAFRVCIEKQEDSYLSAYVRLADGMSELASRVDPEVPDEKEYKQRIDAKIRFLISDEEEYEWMRRVK